MAQNLSDTRDAPLLRLARRSFAPSQKTRRQNRSFVWNRRPFLPPGSSTGCATVESLSSSPWSNLFISFSLLPPSTSILPSCNSLKPSFAVKSEKKLNFVIDRAGNIGNWSLEFSLISVLLGLLNSFKNCRKHFYYISPLCISHTLTVLSQSAYIFAACHYNLVLPRGLDVWGTDL